MSVLEQIGNTQLVRLDSFGELELYAKLEYKNPSGSIKDRIALRMIRDAEDAGKLKEGMGVIEVSSGNTGIAIAMVGGELGYDVTIVGPQIMTSDAKRRIKSYGAKLVQVDGFFNECFKRVKQIMDNNLGHYYWTNQTENPVALKSNEELGNEIAAELSIDVFIVSMGTGSTMTGVGKALKKKNPKVQVYLVLPANEYSVPGVESYKDTTVELPLFDRSVVDHEITVAEEEAIDGAKILNSQYGHYVGVSSGAVFTAAKKIAEKEKGNAVIIFPDSGNRYTNILGGG